MSVGRSLRVAQISGTNNTMHALVLTGLLLSQGMRPLITVDDYPEIAIQRGWEGEVVADLQIDEHGKVTGCTIV
jgi:outer membrane biosynthesis protein TonB